MGWIQRQNILDIKTDRIPYAYPILDVRHTDSLKAIIEYLNTFHNLWLSGRNSLFKYTHFHDMMIDGRKIAEALG